MYKSRTPSFRYLNANYIWLLRFLEKIFLNLCHLSDENDNNYCLTTQTVKISKLYVSHWLRGHWLYHMDMMPRLFPLGMCTRHWLSILSITNFNIWLYIWIFSRRFCLNVRQHMCDLLVVQNLVSQSKNHGNCFQTFVLLKGFRSNFKID